MIALLISIIALVFAVACLLANMYTYGSMIQRHGLAFDLTARAAVWVYKHIEKIRRGRDEKV